MPHFSRSLREVGLSTANCLATRFSKTARSGTPHSTLQLTVKINCVLFQAEMSATRQRRTQRASELGSLAEADGECDSTVVGERSGVRGRVH